LSTSQLHIRRQLGRERGGTNNRFDFLPGNPYRFDLLILTSSMDFGFCVGCPKSISDTSVGNKCGGVNSDKINLFVFREVERRRKVQGKGLWTRAQMPSLLAQREAIRKRKRKQEQVMFYLCLFWVVLVKKVLLQFSRSASFQKKLVDLVTKAMSFFLNG
jgi:hypothetical protein